MVPARDEGQTKVGVDAKPRVKPEGNTIGDKVDILPGPKFNWRRLLKRHYIWLATHKCRHSMNYLAHPSCYFEEKPWILDCDAPGPERVGFLDIETTGLKANWDFTLCYCLKELDGTMIKNSVTQTEIRDEKYLREGIEFDADKRLIKDCIEDISKFDRIVVHYGKDRRHDIPFVRTRALRFGLNFLHYGDCNVTDTYDMAKSKLSLHSYRLESICDFFDVPAKGHKLKTNIWQRARLGNTHDLDWILEHCAEDVISLEAVWKMLVPFFRGNKTSI